MQDFHLPMNIRVLLDIIRKVEKYSYAVMDMKAMSSSILHRCESLIQIKIIIQYYQFCNLNIL